MRDAGVQRRNRETGDGRRKDHVDVLRLQARLVERGGQCRTPEIDRVFDEDVVRVAEVGQGWVLLQRQYQVATVDLGTRVQFAQKISVSFESRESRRASR